MHNWKRDSIKLLSGFAHCLLNKGLLSFIKNLESLTCSSPINQSSQKNLSKLFTERRRERYNPAPSETHCSEIPEDFRVDKSQLERRDSEGNTPLLSAVLGNKMDAVQWLVENGANIDATNNEGNSALHLSASKKSSLGIARYLIDNGIQLELQNRTGDTPLHCASLARNSNLAHLLIEKAANVNAVQESGRTALHFAIAVHAIDIARDLIHNGAQLEARDKTGQTPLFFAVKFNTLEGVKLLVENGADINARIGG